jgi:hypothetical protein
MLLEWQTIYINNTSLIMRYFDGPDVNHHFVPVGHGILDNVRIKGPRKRMMSNLFLYNTF